ncbi:ras GEF [Cristinia sonorae]|uniref:Ras GEF n=1 Tax=Cristinia sonorae TaxID=1940300 RepID=A0A8K0XRP7_9AGAR|nr:ras GEF [Cristinia sonorae]
MSFTTNPVDLPKIPSLPPIEMPDTSSFLGTASSTTEDQDSLSPLRPSILSAESYMTANSSFSVSSNSGTTPDASSSTQLLVPPTNLRKSISVDSFIKFRHLSSSTRPNRGNTTASVMPPQAAPRQASPSTGLRREHSHPTVPAQGSSWRDGERLSMHSPSARGASASTDDRDYFDESDMERSEDLRRDVVKRKSMARHTVRDGELTLPSRLPASSPASRAPDPIVPVRSSSTNQRQAKQRTTMAVNTKLSVAPRSRSELVIAVVGAPETGRTTVIRKGLKAYGLSEVKMGSVPLPHRASEVFSYTYRVGRIVQEPENLLTLRVLEIDMAALDLTQTHATELCPEGVPVVDGLVICYDASRESSFTQVADLIRTFAHLRLPSVVLACKSDLEKHVDPHRALSVLKSLSVSTHYDVGLVETTTESEHGKQKIRMAFEWIFQTLLNPDALLSARDDTDPQYNPASPAILSSTPSPWDINRAESATPTAASSFFGSTQPQRQRLLSHAPPTSSDGTVSPTSPVRARSTSDLLSENRREGERDWDRSTNSGSVIISLNGTGSGASLQLGPLPPSEAMSLGSLDEGAEASRENVSSKEPRASPWVSLQDLLNKLLFLAVSEDDAAFISYFLLTYRRFASPRSILLAMQKRMRALDEPTGDPMFACFAQMKICCLLDNWMRLYPNDFAVPGTAGALSALLKSVLGKTYLLQYGSEFIPFMELLPTLEDKDAAWALKVEDPKYDSDDSSSMDTSVDATSTSSNVPALAEPSDATVRSRTQSTSTNRDRKSSIPLSHRAAIAGPPIHHASEALSHKAVLKKLQAVCGELNQYDPTDIAQEITRHESELFVLINPRHWMQHVLASGRKDSVKDPIAVYNRVSNHIAHWVLSLILCHDKPKARAKQIDRFAEIAKRLRNMNNYSALRAVVAGINGATFEGDEAIDLFKTKNAQLWKVFQSFDHLLQAVRSHQRYRMALRNTSGACIPALEIHLSDLIRAHEGNPDFHEDDTEKIHWAKFNMMGRFIDVVTQCQRMCKESTTFKFTDRPHVWRLLMFSEADHLMDEELQRTRTSLPDLDMEDPHRPNLPRTLTRDDPSVPKDSAILRKIFFW